MTSRREFLCLSAAGLFSGCRIWGEDPDPNAPAVRFGMVTDIHYASIPSDTIPRGYVGWRHYRESRNKLTEAVAVFNARKLDFAIELGDFKDDSGSVDETLFHLDSIETAFARFEGPRYHVTGNHDLDVITPEEFYSRTPNDGVVSQNGYYAFEKNGITFIVLNATYRSDGAHWSRKNQWEDANVPDHELKWLKARLTLAEGPVFAFCHQRLEDSAERNHIVRNAAAVRDIFEKSGKVKGVFTGHQHMGGANVVNGIPYYSLRAMVHGTGPGENSFAEVAIYPSGKFTVYGWRNAVSQGIAGEFPNRGLIAHRGDAVDAPENTCRAFVAAIAKKAEMIEFDVRRCKTGELVVIHDPRVDATTDGKGSVAFMTLSQIRKLHIRKGNAITRERIPVFFEALAKFPKTGLYLNIHCKGKDAAEEIACALKRTGRLPQGILMMDSRQGLLDLQKKSPWVKTGLVLATDAGWAKPWSEEEAWRKLRDAASLGVSFVQILPNCHLTQEQMKYLHDYGIRTTYFFANDAETLRTVYREGHDFIFTDRYLEMRKVYSAL